MRNINYVFNPAYKLINDKDRIILMSNPEFMTDGFFCFLHPIHALLLSFFTGEENIELVSQKIKFYFEIDDNDLYRIVYPLLENKKNIVINYDGNKFISPPNVLIKNENNIERVDLI